MHCRGLEESRIRNSESLEGVQSRGQRCLEGCRVVQSMCHWSLEGRRVQEKTSRGVCSREKSCKVGTVVGRGMTKSLEECSIMM